MDIPKVYKAHWLLYEGIYFTCGKDWPNSQELDEEEFVKLSDYEDLFNSYNELKFRMDGLDK